MSYRVDMERTLLKQYCRCCRGH